MVILFNACRPVKTRKPFGLGITRAARERRVPYTTADRAWAAANMNRDTTQYEVVERSDAELDRLARESAEMDAVCRGIVPL